MPTVAAERAVLTVVKLFVFWNLAGILKKVKQSYVINKEKAAAKAKLEKVKAKKAAAKAKAASKPKAAKVRSCASGCVIDDSYCRINLWASPRYLPSHRYGMLAALLVRLMCQRDRRWLFV